VRFYTTLLTFVLGAYYIRIKRWPTRRQIAGYVVAVNAVAAGWSGFYLSMQEDARSRYGRVVPGSVSERISSTGELGTRTIGRWLGRRGAPGYDPLRIITSEGSRLHEVVARHIVTGSPSLWVIDYRYDCGRPQPCWGRDFVGHERWLRLQAGAAVNVRYVPDAVRGARLEDNPQWAVSTVELALGALLAVTAAGLFGALPALVRYKQRLQTMAVVTAVERVEYRSGPRWRVRFSYLDDLGQPHEASDEFAIDRWQVGDTGVAVYEVAEPDCAGLLGATTASNQAG
jgi:hypothetical protein